jgi:hypothetical protein
MEQDDFEEFTDKYLLNDSYFLHKSIDRSLSIISKSVQTEQIQNGLMAKVLEVDQTIELAKAMGLVTTEEIQQIKDENNTNSNDDTEKLTNDAKLANRLLGFVLHRVKEKKPAIIKGII